MSKTSKKVVYLTHGGNILLFLTIPTSEHFPYRTIIYNVCPTAAVVQCTIGHTFKWREEK